MAGLPFPWGPVQLLVIAVDGDDLEPGILDQLRRLREHDALSLIDLLLVAKDDLGVVRELEQRGPSTEEAVEYGAVIRRLMGLGPDGVAEISVSGNGGNPTVDHGDSRLDSDDVWFLADTIPLGTAAAIALVEHRWAIPLRDAIGAAGDHDLVDRWIHPADLSTPRRLHRDPSS